MCYCIKLYPVFFDVMQASLSLWCTHLITLVYIPDARCMNNHHSIYSSRRRVPVNDIAMESLTSYKFPKKNSFIVTYVFLTDIESKLILKIMILTKYINKWHSHETSEILRHYWYCLYIDSHSICSYQKRHYDIHVQHLELYEFSKMCFSRWWPSVVILRLMLLLVFPYHNNIKKLCYIHRSPLYQRGITLIPA